MTDINNRNQQILNAGDPSGREHLEDEIVHINKKDLPVGFFGESLLPSEALYPGLKKLEVVLPEKSAAGTETSIIKKFMTNKMVGHGLAYEDLEQQYGHTYEVEKLESTSLVEADGATEEFMGITKEVATLDLPEVDGSIGHFTPVTIKTKSSGIIAQMLYCPETREIKVLFRGTSDAATAAADFEIGGPGAESFAEDANTILAQVNEVAGKIGATKVSVSGHSLGGALSQLCVSQLIEAKAQNHGLKRTGQDSFPENTRNHLANITELHADVFNPAGVAKKVCDRVKESLTYLKSREPNFNMAMNYCLVGGDLVQQLYNKILIDVGPELALVTLLKLQNGYEGWGLPTSIAGAAAGAVAGTAIAGPVGGVIGGFLGAAGSAVPAAKNTHCDMLYLNQNSQNRDVRYIIASNETKEGRALIQKEVGQKTVLTDTIVSNTVQSGVVTGVRAVNNHIVQPILAQSAVVRGLRAINNAVKTVKRAVVENVINPVKNAISKYIVNPISGWWRRKPAEVKPQPSAQAVKRQSSAVGSATARQRLATSTLNAARPNVSKTNISNRSFASTDSPHARAQARVATTKFAAATLGSIPPVTATTVASAAATTTAVTAKPQVKATTTPVPAMTTPVGPVSTKQAVCFQKQREDQTQKIANLDLVRAMQQRFYMAISPIEKSILSICSDAKMSPVLNAKQLEEFSLIGKKINAFPYRMLNKELNLKEGVADVVGILKDLTRFFKENSILATTLAPSIQESMKSLGYFLHSAFHEVSKENLPADMKAGIKRGLDFMNTNFLELDTLMRTTLEGSYVSKVLMKNAQDVG